LVELNTTISPVRDSNGRIVNYVAVSHDVTRETELQDQLRQAHKMEAIGRLAGGIAHDFNNLLTAMMGNADLVLRRLGPDAPVREDVEQIREAAQQAAGLIAQLLTFSRKQVVNPRIVQLNETVTSLARMLTRVIGQHIRLETDLEARLSPIRIDPVQLEQVIMNLALNARDAMPQGGTLTLRTRSVRIDRPENYHLADIEPGLYTVLDVIDTGIGMDAKTQARIFEPFFTTKEAGRGTGLGLSTVYGIVRQCGGAIEVHSAPGKGATFTVYFPQARAALATAPGIAAPPDARRRTVLLVDDEAPIRKLINRMLRDRGFDVVEAADGQEALDCLRRNGTGFDLIVTDVVMPKLDGLRLASVARAEFPGLPVIVMSGHPETADLKPEDLSGTPFYVRKPFRTDQLMETVERAIRSSAATPR
jgi:signal transduction histidine kinase/ActR/RegA family two-component response regulator